MGQSFESIRMAVKDVSASWLKASKALKKEDQIYGQRISEMAKERDQIIAKQSSINNSGY